MNEFADTATVNVSSPDDPAASSEEILELANGCLCCSIKDSGAAAIEKLMQRKGAFDHILLETTGLADPGPIASIFWHNEELAAGLGRDIKLDGVVCVVDAVFGAQQMQEDHGEDPDRVGESLKQIAGADVVLLNKSDLVTPDKLAHIETLIERVNPAAPIHRTVRGDVDLALIMDISAFSAPPPAPLQNTHAHIHDADCEHTPEPTHYELRGISSLQVACPPLSVARFARLDAWLRSVLWENRIPEAQTTQTQTTATAEEQELLVLRCKGLLAIQGGKQYVLQGVRSMYDLVELEGEAEAEDVAIPQLGKIVLIGKGLGEHVRESLRKVLEEGDD
ncbi:hypothetical protein H0H81_008228 [Sphagnurus paluster]|uniref:COBW domain-containing protein 1 n=1 Tax=Sphagnurus paluster TaxID=117069 RepID=A0A9P7FST2_9AGAR|nr:hypothetical protein H0H81_008228 [Sphagnurus paluster]